MTTRFPASSAHDRITELLRRSLLAPPAAARVLVTIALADLQRSCGAATATNCRLWSLTHDALAACVADLEIAADPRANDWRWQAGACRQVADEMRRTIQSRRPGSRVIDTVATEVVS